MNKLFTLPVSKDVVDISKIVAIRPIREDYKYVEPYLFTVVFVTLDGEANVIFGNDTYAQAQDDYGALMQAWQDFINKEPQ